MMACLSLVIPVYGQGVVINSDCCTDALVMPGEGVFGFDNTTATLDGPGHATCARVGFGEDQIDLDVWAKWTSPCTATVFVQTCGLTDVDTRLVVYDGQTCPVTDGRLLSCNDDRCDLQSQVTFEAITGQDYLIRIGSFPGEPGGVGSVSITCGINACPGTGDCLTANGSVGCNDESCCETVCNVDPFCCDIEWDENCALEAGGLCSGSFDSCIAGAGDCTIALEPVCRGGLRDTLICVDDSNCPEGVCVIPPPGCGDVDCCNAVCLDDPFCCINTWDEFCVAAEATTCFNACGAGRGGCFTARAVGSEQAGCEDIDCCAEVCPRDLFCCTVEWDQTCVDKAQLFCTDSRPACPSGEIVWVDPPDGVVDARYPVDPIAGTPLGIDTIFVQGPPGIQRECWTLCETDPKDMIIESLVVEDSCGSYQLKLNRPITAGAVTTITYRDEFGNTSTGVFTSHPANANADGLSSAVDVGTILDGLNRSPIPVSGTYSTDIDHSGEFHPSDILAIIDLLNGADPFKPWMNTPKPVSENICP